MFRARAQDNWGADSWLRNYHVAMMHGWELAAQHRGYKPLSCLYQHGPQPGRLANYVLEILLFIEKSLLESLYSSGVYLSSY